MIVILTQPDDVHADAVMEKLARQRADVLRLDEGEFPTRLRASIALAEDGRTRSLLRAGDREIDLESISVVWRRRPSAPVAPPEITDPRLRSYAEAECKQFMEDLWHTLPCAWVPAVSSVVRRAEHKAAQLRLAGELGFELPPTLITNDPSEVIDFYRAHGGRLVSKLIGPALFRMPGERLNRYTQEVTRRDIVHADSVRLAPIVFQAYVQKRVELRITVVGHEVFAAEIHSQSANHTRVDWRRYDLSHTPHFPHELPGDVRARCVELVRRLGLCYGAIDMVVTPEGRYVFLEINPSGQYLWIEQVTGLPISEAICGLLLRHESSAARAQAA